MPDQPPPPPDKSTPHTPLQLCTVDDLAEHLLDRTHAAIIVACVPDQDGKPTSYITVWQHGNRSTVLGLAHVAVQHAHDAIFKDPDQ